jgi:large subunit ribosomal protein L4
MAKVDVYNRKREKVGSVDLADEVFAADVKEQLFHEVVVAQLASRRAGTHAAKERSAVAGSSKKIYKQKGTGRARHGSIRAPLFWAVAVRTRPSRKIGATARHVACVWPR